MKQQAGYAAEDRPVGLALEEPLIAKQKALLTDPDAALSAAMPELSKISQGYTASKSSIMNQIPPGAARDMALAQLQQQQQLSQSSILANEVQNAPSILAQAGASRLNQSNIGTQLATGAGQTSASTASNVENSADARKAQTMSNIGGLLGMGGSMAGGSSGGGGILGALSGLSDLRLKTSIRTLDSVLDSLKAFSGVRFAYRANPSRIQIGVIAQDVATEFPELIMEASGHLLVDYGGLAAVALQAVKELHALVEKQDKRIRSLEHEAVMARV
jgi:hypothetical protein